MSVDAVVHTEFPAGYMVLFGADKGDHDSAERRALQHDQVDADRLAVARPSREDHLRRLPGLPRRRELGPDFAILREDARRQSKRYSFEDVLLISEVVSVSSARKDYDDCTAKYGRYGIPVYVVVDPYAAEVVVHTQPTGTGYSAAHTRAYGTGKLPIELADGRTYTLDLDELPRPNRTTDTR